MIQEKVSKLANVSLIWFFTMLYFCIGLFCVPLLFVNPQNPFSVVFVTGVVFGFGMSLLCGYITFDYISNGVEQNE